jgi:fatty acid desaturase
MPCRLGGSHPGEMRPLGVAQHRRAEVAPLLLDPRVRAARWRDLQPLRPMERLWELILPLPWLLLELVAVRHGLWALALIGSFYFFLTGLRLVHDTFHGNLGLPGWANDAVLAALSALMLGSMHAVRLTHLQHHRECLGPNDVEGAAARRSAAGAVLWGVVFPIQLHVAAVHIARPRQLRWILGELTLSAAAIVAMLASENLFVSYHVAAMAVGQALSGFFAVWTVHHDCDRWHQIARTLRHHLKSVVVCNMFYHLEHHLYPQVPTCHLPALAERLDQTMPELTRKQVY